MNTGNNRLKSAILSTTVLFSLTAVPAYAQATSIEDEIRDSWIVVLKSDTAKRNIPNIARASAEKSRGKIGFVYKNSIKGFSIKAPIKAIEKLIESNPNIDYVEPDAIAYAFPKPPGKGNGDSGDTSAPSQTVPWGITRVGGGSDTQTFDTTMRAWVIDTGIDLDHPDLNVHPLCANFVFRGKSTCDDGNGHGTHVAGIIGARDNNFGVVGVAPGATVFAVRVLDNNGSGSYSGVIAGVDYVATNGRTGEVANMSLGGPVSQALDDAVLAASEKVKFVIAAGNDYHANAANFSPARVNGDNVYTVSAIDDTDTFATFSNTGNPPIDYAAPGVAINSTWKGGGYNTISGTSMAAPHVAGLLMLGDISVVGYAVGDPDGSPDAIAGR